MIDDRSRTSSLRSGELARIAGVSTDTLRHYERKGVLARPRRSANGYREYSANSVDRVRLIQRALAVGFTLDELSKVLAVRDLGGTPCKQVRELAASKLADIETQLKEMTAIRNALRQTLKDWDRRLEETADGERAALLHSLAADDSKPFKLSTRSSIWRSRKRGTRNNHETE
jgi:DNA-binding transcriptional MerR regulator